MRDFIHMILRLVATLALVNMADSLFRLGLTMENILEAMK